MNDFSKRKERSAKSALFICLLFFAGLAALLIFSNGHDWDHFFTTFEVERRSWLSDFKPPLWSYQFCGGSSRWGDPQSFGLSPLFIFPLVFGSFWGAKILFIFCFAAGVLYLKKSLILVWEDLDDSSAIILSSLAVFGNFLLWNAYAGHLTYGPALLYLSAIYYSLLALRRKLFRKEFILAAFWVWTCLSGGLYVAAVYLMAPLFLAFLVAVILREVPIASARRIVSFHALGIAAAAYKLWPVIDYQLKFPRSLLNGEAEYNSLHQIFLFEALPTWGLQFVGFVNPKKWFVWEFSFFSSLVPLFLGLLLIRVFKPAKSAGKTFPGIFVTAHALICLLLSVGDFSSWAPFSVLNSGLAAGAMRVPSRFLLGPNLLLPFAVCCVAGSLKLLGNNKYRKIILGAGVLGLINILTFAQLTNPQRLGEIATDLRATAGSGAGEIKILEWNTFSNMYPSVRRNRAVLNCYQPMAREIVLPELKEGLGFPLVDIREGVPDVACVQGTFLTQNDIIISPRCAPGTCFNINSLNTYRDSPLRFDSIKGRYCLKP